MPDRTCVVCAELLPPNRRADAIVCSNACSSWRRKHPGLRRPRGEQSYTCEHCEATFTRPKLVSAKAPRFCGDRCREARRHLNRPFGEWRVAQPYLPRSFQCVDCGHEATASGKGPVPTRCAPCAAAFDRQTSSEWQQAHPQRANARKAQWAAANPDKVGASRERARPNRAAQQKKYQDLNRDRVRAWKRDRQARRRATAAGVTAEKFRAIDIFERDRWVCGICGDRVDPEARLPDRRRASLDHVIPLSRGGFHTPANTQLTHLSCNIRKGASLP